MIVPDRTPREVPHRDAGVREVAGVGRRERIAGGGRDDPVAIDPDPESLQRRAIREPLHGERVSAPPLLAHLQGPGRKPRQEVVERVGHVHDLVHLVGHERPVTRREGAIGGELAPVLSAQQARCVGLHARAGRDAPDAERVVPRDHVEPIRLARSGGDQQVPFAPRRGRRHPAGGLHRQVALQDLAKPGAGERSRAIHRLLRLALRNDDGGHDGRRRTGPASQAHRLTPPP